MANIRSAEKRVRQTERRTLRNKMVKSRVKTAIRRFREALSAGASEQVEVCFRAAVSLLDKAAKKGVIHKNEADRRKARLARQLNQTRTA